MKLKRVKIGPIVFDVVEEVNLIGENRRLDGRITYAEAKIRLDRDLNKQSMIQTLLHEMVHAVAQQLGRPIEDEDLIDAIAYSVYQVLQDNPDLWKEITT